MPELKRPLDGGSGVFGDNKTWRGALMMSGGTIAATAALTRFDWFLRRLPAELRDAPPLAYGALLGAGVVLGELPNSFLKRRLGIAPGARQKSAAGGPSRCSTRVTSCSSHVSRSRRCGA